MSDPLFLGVDIGTYSAKGVLAREDGTIVATRVVEHALDIPGPGRAEHDPEKVWWQGFIEICRTLLATPGVEPRQVQAVGISTVSPAIVAVDREGRALRPAILYGIDTRATAEIAELERLTGAAMDSQSAAPKVLWIRRNEPEVWARAHRIVNGSGFLTLRLTGQATIDIYDAFIFAPFFDTTTLAWSPEIAPMVAPVELMPRPTWACEIAGRLTAAAARETGLASGTPVITGTADAAAEALSAGLSLPGDMMVMYGSSTFFILRTETLTTARGFWGSAFLDKESFVVAGGTATAGSLTRWFRDNFAGAETAAERAGGENAYAALAELAAGSPAGARGLVALPYFSGERTPLHDPDARGAILGLTLGHTRADIYRALLESVGFAIRHNIEALAAQGCRARRIFAVGGGTRNRLWMQMVSDIAGIEQVLPTRQIGASYGDAFMAAVGVGVFSGMREISRWVRPESVVHPHGDAGLVYQDFYRVYRALYDQNAALMHELARLGR